MATKRFIISLDSYEEQGTIATKNNAHNHYGNMQQQQQQQKDHPSYWKKSLQNKRTRFNAASNMNRNSMSTNHRKIKNANVQEDEEEEEIVVQGHLNPGTTTTPSKGNKSFFHRVYVGNIPWDTSWQELKDHMRTSGGTVGHVEILVNAEGKSKGCAVVEYATNQQAQQAIDILNGTELNGRQIYVREDREETEEGGDAMNATHAKKTTKIQTNQLMVFVGNISYETSWQTLKDHMRKAGNVDYANILVHEDGSSKGCAVVKYQKHSEVIRAIRELNQSILDERQIFVRENHEQGGHYANAATTTSTISNPYSATASNTLSHDNVSNVLFVGNIPYETSWQDLKDLFRQYGDVDYVNVMEYPDGRKKGFGTVKFVHNPEALAAIQHLHGVEFQGRVLEVRWDRKAVISGTSQTQPQVEEHDEEVVMEEEEQHHENDDTIDPTIQDSSTQVFVGNLSYDTSWQDLKDYFRQCGYIDHVDVYEYPDGRKKGCGTVKFTTRESAQEAIQSLNGTSFQGRVLEVRWDLKKSTKRFEAKSNHSGAGANSQRQIFVGNLPYGMTWKNLKEVFSLCGEVERADVIEDRQGRSKGIGTVKFVNPNDALSAIKQLDGTDLNGRILEVKFDDYAR